MDALNKLTFKELILCIAIAGLYGVQGVQITLAWLHSEKPAHDRADAVINDTYNRLIRLEALTADIQAVQQTLVSDEDKRSRAELIERLNKK